MKRQLISGVMIAVASLLLLAGCSSTGNESAGGQPDNLLHHKADTAPENNSGLGSKAPVVDSTVRPTDEATREENRRLSEGILDENGNPTK